MLTLLVYVPIELSAFPGRRINPFDQSTVAIHSDNNPDSTFYETFEVRFLGSMEVRHDKGEYNISHLFYVFYISTSCSTISSD